MTEEILEPAGQLERTALAWNRSLLGLAANGALLVRIADSSGRWAAAVGVVVLATAVSGWLVASVAYRRSRGSPARALLLRGAAAVWVAVVMVVVGVADLVAVAGSS